MTEQAFVDGSFTAPRERRERLTAALLEHVPAQSSLRLLDLGCGNGLQLLDLADALPRALLAGIDTSRVNIDSARRRISESVHAARVSVRDGDYLALDGEPYDVIVADSVLQNIPVADDRLYDKLAGDLRPDGLLIASLPYACAFNRLLWCARRGLRLFRGPVMERAALALAGRLHPEWDRALLQERLPYLYMTPARIDDAALVTSLAARDLQRIAATPLPHASLAQPKHRLSVFRKGSSS